MAKKQQPFLPMFVGDFLAATAEWEGEEQALYALLLMHQWALGHLPIETPKLARLVKYEQQNFERSWAVVSTKFELREVEGFGNRLMNPRLEQHRDRVTATIEKKSAAGKLGAESKWHKDGISHTETMADATRTDGISHRSANVRRNGIQSNPIQSNPIHPTRTQDSEGSSGGDLIRNSNSEAAEANGRDFSSEGSPPKEPSPRRRGAAAEPRNGDFEDILERVSKLLEAGGFSVDNPAAIAQSCWLSTAQVEVAIRQLRDRGRLPAVAA